MKLQTYDKIAGLKNYERFSHLQTHSPKSFRLGLAYIFILLCRLSFYLIIQLLPSIIVKLYVFRLVCNNFSHVWIVYIRHFTSSGLVI